MANRVKKLGPRVTVSVTATNLKALSTLADRDSVSVSWVVRRAIAEYLKHHGKTQASSSSDNTRLKKRASASERI